MWFWKYCVSLVPSFCLRRSYSYKWVGNWKSSWIECAAIFSVYCVKTVWKVISKKISTEIDPHFRKFIIMKINMKLFISYIILIPGKLQFFNLIIIRIHISRLKPIRRLNAIISFYLFLIYIVIINPEGRIIAKPLVWLA